MCRFDRKEENQNTIFAVNALLTLADSERQKTQNKQNNQKNKQTNKTPTTPTKRPQQNKTKQKTLQKTAGTKEGINRNRSLWRE